LIIFIYVLIRNQNIMSVCLIVPLKSPGKTVQLEHGHTNNGTKLIVSEKISSYNGHNIQRQMWFWDGEYFRSFANPIKCLSLQGRSTNNGTLIVLGDIVSKGRNDSTTQRWRIEGKMIINRKAPSMAWNLKDGKTNNGTQIQVWKRNDEDYGWNVQLVEADPWNDMRLRGRCVITCFTKPGKTIQLENGNTAAGTELVIRDRIAVDDRNFEDQLWLWDGLRFRSGKDPTMSLQLQLGRTTNGTRIQLRNILPLNSRDRANQEFFFEGWDIVNRKYIRSCWHTDGNKVLVWRARNHVNGTWTVEFLDQQKKSNM